MFFEIYKRHHFFYILLTIKIINHESNNYNFIGNFFGKTPVSDSTIKNIQDFGLSQEVIINGLRDCNCRWSCDWYIGGNGGNCTKTSSGCGFFVGF